MKKDPHSKIEIVRGDITKLDVDAIVNAANATLLGGGGVDGAIHRAAGPELLAECRTLGGCQTGEAKLTRGYRLPARFVIHTVGPIWTGGKRGEAQILANCYRNSLQIAAENGIKTVAFPAISCGAYRYPIGEAARIALETTREFLANTDKIDKVIFVLWSEELFRAYQVLL
jgi:O-acetyl-ADP-ribose deacetylase (regulator of RNase III)